ncbi:MAG: hypothetical protein LBG47_07220 [Prevotellaceae bacterium]|jgi:hypothetical protein|nr:hypothetical protein [Prevotellaceae bacterium]
MRKLYLAIPALLLSSAPLPALNDASLRFRAAGVDVASQTFYVQWSLADISDTADVKGFRVLKLVEDPQGNIIMDTLAEVGNRATRFTDDSAPCCTPGIYAVQLISKEPLGGGFVYQPPFRTMQLRSATLDACANAISLQWSPYQQLDQYSISPPVPLPAFTSEVRYHLYGHIGGDAFDPDSAVWLATSNGATSLTLPVAKEKQRYHLYVAAVYNNGKDTSYSNRTDVFVPTPIRPQHIHLDSVLSERQSTTLRFRIDPATEYTRFWAEKSPEINGAYRTFEEFSDKRQTSITDNASGVSYSFYRISAVNACERVTASSAAVTSLAPAVLGETTPAIRWDIAVWHDAGSGATHRAQRYSVRRTSPPGAAGPVADTDDLSLSDDLSHLPDSVACAGQRCYRVEADILDNSRQPLAYVRSAEACTAVANRMEMPNAVQPGSEARNEFTGKSRSMFEPLCACMKEYTLAIYTANGRLVYSGAEPWNARENNSGNFVAQAAYIYHIKITFVSGEQAEKTGTVTVVY